MAEPIAERPHMPDYGVDTDKWVALPWSWAVERLEQSRNLWVVTASATGRPHALPVWGVWDDDVPGFGWSCAPGSRKAANLAANPQVCVMVDAWIDRYLGKYGGEGVTAEFLRENALFEMLPERAFGIIEREDDFSNRATRWRFR